MIKTVQWNTTERLACACCTPAPVHIKIGLNQTIPATLVSVTALGKSKCSPASSFQYSFSYDEDVLPGDATSISGTDISGVLCEGAITAWVNQLVNEAIRPTLYRPKVFKEAIDFLGQPSGFYEDTSLVLTNPSALRPMEIDVFFRWQLTMRSSVAMGYNGVGMRILIDGIEQPAGEGYRNLDANYMSAVDAPCVIDLEGGSGIFQVSLEPSEAKTFTLRLIKIVSSVPEPDTHYFAERIAIYGMGITV